MKIIRYQNSSGTIGYASEQTDGSALEIVGDIYDKPQVTEPPRWLREGDEIVIEIEKIGSLKNPVRLEMNR